ncbi:hypothetical protein BC830DRAFT_1121308 [Chytriomyces sp. MP71]|nr:hypothetical protein BC830DRAFT_1121308 [Chytriomyces sp. MP71]
MDAMIAFYNSCNDQAAYPFNFSSNVPATFGSKKYNSPASMQQVCQGLGISLIVTGGQGSASPNPSSSSSPIDQQGQNSPVVATTTMGSPSLPTDQQVQNSPVVATTTAGSLIIPTSTGQGQSSVRPVTTAPLVNIFTTNNINAFSINQNAVSSQVASIQNQVKDAIQGISTAVIIGIVVGALVFLSCIGALVYFLCFRKKDDAVDSPYGLLEPKYNQPVVLTYNEPVAAAITRYTEPSNAPASQYSDTGMNIYNRSTGATTSSEPVWNSTSSASYPPQGWQNASSHSSNPANSTASSTAYQRPQAGALPTKGPNALENTLNASYAGAAAANGRNPAFSLTLANEAASTNPAEWTMNQAAAWAHGISHVGPRLSDLILHNRIDGTILLGMSRDDIRREFGLVYGDAITVFNAIDSIRNEMETPPMYDSGVQGIPATKDVKSVLRG